MRIGIDVDEVLYPTLEAFCIFIKRYGFNLAEEDFPVYDFSLHTETEEECRRYFMEFCQSSLFRQMKPIKGACSGILRLSREAELVAISARQEELREHTETVLQKHFFAKIQELYLGDRMGNEISKYELVRKARGDLLIEDDPYHIEEIVGKIPVILFPYGKRWNRDYEVGERVYTASRWGEVTELVRKIKF